MPTPIIIDGFEHKIQSAPTPVLGISAQAIWASISGTGVSYVTGRNGQAIQFSPAAAACNGTKVINSTVIVGSVYFKFSSNPSQITMLYTQLGSPSFSIPVRFYMNPASGGQIFAQGGGDALSSMTGLANNAWHLLDFRMDTSGTTWVMDWYVDGIAQTQCSTGGQVSTPQENFVMGTGDVGTGTMQFDDLVVSYTAGDFPLGAHDVLYSVPTGDGTHVAGTNTIEDNAGVDIVSPNAFPLLDELPPTTTDYIQQSTIGTGNYAEVTLTDAPAGKTIWGVEGIVTVFSSGTLANNGTARIVDSGGTTLTDIWSGDMSETGLRYQRAIIADPSGNGWTKTDFDGLKARVGFSSDVIDVPRWAALMLQYLVTYAGDVPTLRGIPALKSPRRAPGPPLLRKQTFPNFDEPLKDPPPVAPYQFASVAVGIRFPRRGPRVLVQQRPGIPPIPPIPQAVDVTTAFTAGLEDRANKMMAAAATATVALSRMVGKPIVAAATATIALAKQITEAIAAVMTATVALTRQVGKPIVVDVTAAIALTKTKVALILMAVTATVTAALTRMVRKPIAVASTATVALAKRVAASVVAAVMTATVVLAKTKVAVVLLAASAAVSAGLTRMVGKPIAAAATVTVVLARRVGKAIAVAMTATVALTRQVGKPIVVDVTAAIALTKVLVKIVALAITATVTALMSRRVGKLVSAAATVTVALGKKLPVRIAAAATFTVSIAKSVTKSIAVAAVVTVVLIRSTG